MLISKYKKEVYEEIKTLSIMACSYLDLCIENITWYKDDPKSKEISVPFDIAKQYIKIIDSLITNYETIHFENINGFIEKFETFEKYYVRYLKTPNNETFRQVSSLLPIIQEYQKEI